MKKGKINKAWKNRWCIITEINGDVYLQYYQSKIDNTLCGTIEFSQIYDIKVVHHSEYDLTFLGHIPTHIKLTNEIKTDQKYAFIIYTTKRKWIFSAFDPKNFDKWMVIFDKYIYNGILKRGWLEKRGEKNTAWKRRYFVLNQYKQLKYYQDDTLKKHLGTIQLNQVIKTELHKDKDYTFHLITDNRVWVLASKNATDRRQWVDVVNKWRKTTVHHMTFSLIDDVKETWDNYGAIPAKSVPLESVRESKSIDHLDLDRTEEEYKYNHHHKQNKIHEMHEEGEGHNGNGNVMEEWKCASCGQIYATMWPKCPGCLRSNTHYVYYVNE